MSRWEDWKSFFFHPIEGALLEIEGYEFDDDHKGCKRSGLLLECDNGLKSTLEDWTAYGSETEITSAPTEFGNVCESSSSFNINGYVDNSVKIWPENGNKYAWFQTIPIRIHSSIL